MTFSRSVKKKYVCLTTGIILILILKDRVNISLSYTQSEPCTNDKTTCASDSVVVKNETHRNPDQIIPIIEMAAIKRLLSVDFEVFGKVQGVFFRRDTMRTASAHGLVGWVRNTSAGTVVGQVQGPEDKLKIMKSWLTHEGSPWSVISKCLFSNERKISQMDYTAFDIVH